MVDHGRFSWTTFLFQILEIMTQFLFSSSHSRLKLLSRSGLTSTNTGMMRLVLDQLSSISRSTQQTLETRTSSLQPTLFNLLSVMPSILILLDILMFLLLTTGSQMSLTTSWFWILGAMLKSRLWRCATLTTLSSTLTQLRDWWSGWPSGMKTLWTRSSIKILIQQLSW